MLSGHRIHEKEVILVAQFHLSVVFSSLASFEPYGTKRNKESSITFTVSRYGRLGKVLYEYSGAMTEIAVSVSSPFLPSTKLAELGCRGGLGPQVPKFLSAVVIVLDGKSINLILF